MAKLIVTFEGTDEEIQQIAEHISDGGGDQSLEPGDFYNDNKLLSFDYAKCFPAWGYDPDKDGPDLNIMVKVEGTR